MSRDFTDKISSPISAFGEVLIAEPTPVVQVQFPYNINNRLVETRLNNGTATQDTGRIKLSTGAGANQTAMILTRDAVHYSPGQGVNVKFTTIYTAGAANSIQLHGIGDAGDGFFFGFNGTAFGTLHKVGGKSEVRTLTVTTASSTAEDITITLDSDAVATVSVTNTADKTLTANEIAAHDYSNLGKGWRTFVNGDTVIFISYDTGTHTGTYSLSSASTAVGSFAQTIASNAATDTWVAQASWNVDVMDGTGPSGMTLDKTKKNVYQIRYQWLGGGPAHYYIEQDSESTRTGDRWQLVHVLEYTNANTVPSINIPTLPLHMMARNTSNTSDIIMYSSSMAGFIEGKENEIWPVRHGADAENASVDEATEQPILSIRNNILYQGRENRNRIWVKFVSVATSSGNKPVRVHFDVNGTLTGAAFAQLDANDSLVSTDTTATFITGGENQFTIPLNSSDRQFIDLSSERFILGPGDVFTISAQQTVAGTNSTVDVAANWVELF